MEYTQERFATFHDYGDAQPPAPVDEATVVVPLAERDHASPAANRAMEKLEAVDPGRVLIALRADSDAVSRIVEWVDSFEFDGTVLWCTAPAIKTALEANGIDSAAGKGRDVWLAVGVASKSEYVVVHDADATTYDTAHVPKLLFPLANGYDFAKGYYARVENQQLYGRLFRLFYTPLVQVLEAEHHHPFVSYLDSFRYALAGEFAMTAETAQSVRSPSGWGLEVGTLGDTFDIAGFEGTAQVDLGIHKHEHRSVEGSGGLGQMCAEVGETLFTVLEEQGLELDYDRLRSQYHDRADQIVEQYAGDAAFNGFAFDEQREHDQAATYAEAITPPTTDDRLPAWQEIALDPAEIEEHSAAAIDRVTADRVAERD
ncbi:glycosyl transferase family 2 [Halobacteriaceae bacterium SHR40]|uniref:glycosyl transferase family 2 n=1 Tax=Halovenus amylolytica TaxID=2500550 RepID=UPI000FE2C95C